MRITPAQPVVVLCAAFYIPRMTDWAEYCFVMDSFITVSVTKLIALKTGFMHNYNKNAFPGTGRMDDTAYAQVSISL